VRFTESGDSVAAGDLGLKRGIRGFGRFGAKAGKPWFWQIRSQSGETVVLADLELKLGIDLFAGKSEITEGCSDFREIGDSSDLPGISDVRLSKSYGSDAAGTAVAAVDAAGTSMLRWSVLAPSRLTSRASSVGAGID
jgi:hypothetical protein